MQTLTLLKTSLAVCRLEPNASIPSWAVEDQEFFSVSRTADELSIICSESKAPEGIQAEKSWRAFKVEGPLDFSLVGILSDLIRPLAEAGVSIFAVSTYDTDYILVKEEKLAETVKALSTVAHVQGLS